MQILPENIRAKILEPDFKKNTLGSDIRASNKIVFTNGCFDILHLGHLHLLYRAKELGSILIVGLNSDESVSRIKGPSRPVQNQETRISILASLEYVDFVVLFKEDTPEKLIQFIKPDILVKGGDYDIKDIVGNNFVSSYGGKTITIPLLSGFSTTQLIDKSKK